MWCLHVLVLLLLVTSSLSDPAFPPSSIPAANSTAVSSNASFVHSAPLNQSLAVNSTAGATADLEQLSVPEDEHQTQFYPQQRRRRSPITRVHSHNTHTALPAPLHCHCCSADERLCVLGGWTGHLVHCARDGHTVLLLLLPAVRGVPAVLWRLLHVRRRRSTGPGRLLRPRRERRTSASETEVDEFSDDNEFGIRQCITG